MQVFMQQLLDIIKKQIISMTTQRPSCTPQLSTSYIQEFGAMNVSIDEIRHNNYIQQLLQEYTRTN